MNTFGVDLNFDSFPSTDGWHLNPFSNLDWEMEGYIQNGGIIATVESFGDERAYAHALNPGDDIWRRGGCFIGVPAAKAWAERICGVQPRPHDIFPGSTSSPFVEGRS